MGRIAQGRSIQSFLSGGSRLSFRASRQESQEASYRPILKGINTGLW